MNRPCVQCKQGVGIFVCSGCQQAYCRKHADEHRQELVAQVDEVAQNLNVLHQDLSDQNGQSSSMKQIDQWENEAIERIRRIATKAREDLRNSFNQIQTKVTPVKNELKEMRQAESFTENDLNRWIEQLKNYHKDFQRLMNGSVLLNEIDLGRNITPSEEKFRGKEGFVQLLDDGRTALAVSTATDIHLPLVGTCHYSTGVHFRRFRVEQRVGKLMAIGVITLNRRKETTVKLPHSFHGFYSKKVDGYVNSKAPQRFACISIDKGDEFGFYLNCDESFLVFKNGKTGERALLFVDRDVCPLPWALSGGLSGQLLEVKILQ